MTDREFWLAVRQAILLFLDAIERKYLPDITRTSEIRKQARDA